METSGIDLTEVDAALAEVRSGESPTNWFMARYDPNNKQKLLLLGKGEAGFEELLGSLDDSLVLYGCFVFSAANQIKHAQHTPRLPRPSPLAPHPLQGLQTQHPARLPWPGAPS